MSSFPLNFLQDKWWTKKKQMEIVARNEFVPTILLTYPEEYLWLDLSALEIIKHAINGIKAEEQEWSTNE